MESHHSSRPSRLEKQEEFEIEEDGSFMLSPVTIQIEDRGGNQEDDQDDKSLENMYLLSEEDDGLGMSGKSSCDASPDTMDRLQEIRPERRKASSRVKLLVRSHAVHDDASPPPDLDTIVANTNMLSVTNASSFTTQTQTKGASQKLRLDNQSSSQGSTESSSASGLSRDSSTETYTDSSGIDLQQFIVDTLHKNQKDRLMLLKVEQELTLLIKDSKRQSYKFPQMSSYNRMLVHRVAAFFGLDHYVDGNGTAVIVNKTKTTRIPDSRFQDFIRDELLPEEPKKSILKRDSISFEEGKEKSPERQSSTDSRRSKSFEEREEEYEKARARIFNQDEGLGESPLNRSQEGTYSSSRRSSQEDVRWPSSETRPWSSTDSDSSGRPLNVKLGCSFETDVQVGKNSRSLAVITKAESESKSFLVSTKTNRPAMTKASSFGGISVLSRENSGRNITPRITKAESFNVTTISSSLSSTLTDRLFDTPEDSDKVCSNPAPLVSSTIVPPVLPCQFSLTSATAEQTFPIIAGQPTEIKFPSGQESSQQPTNWQSGNQDASKDFGTHTVAVGQPLMWPYSSGTDVLFTSGLFVNPQSGSQRGILPAYQPVAVSTTEQVSATVGYGATGNSLSPSSQSTQHQQPHSTLQSSVQPPQTSVNTSSSSAIFYVPYFSQIQYTAAHQSSITSVQNIRHPTPSSQFLAEPRPIVLFPVCYIHQASNVQPLRHVFPSPNPPQSVQSSGIQGQNVADMKTPGPASSSFGFNPQYLPCFSAIPCTQSAETSLVTTATALYAYSNIVVGNLGSTCPASIKQQYTSQSSQPPVCVQQSAVPLQSAAVTLPPVYVSITSSTQSPATRTHAGGHVASQFSSFRSHSLPVSTSSSSGALNHQFNAGTPFLGYTVYGPPIQSIPTPSTLTAITASPNTLTSALPSQFVPAYVSAFRVLQPNVPLIANVGSNSQTQNAIRSQFTSPTCTVSNVPMSFPLVKQASDPGIGEHLTLSGDLCLVGPPVHQHLRPLLLPQQTSIPRFPHISVSHHSPATRPPKNRKHRCKGSTAATVCQSSQSIFEAGGNHILEIEGLPEDMKRQDMERYLEAVTELGAKIHLLHSENLEVIDESNDFLANSKCIVLAVFECDTAAQNALLNIKTTKFQLRRWLLSQDSSKTNKP